MTALQHHRTDSVYAAVIEALEEAGELTRRDLMLGLPNFSEGTVSNALSELTITGRIARIRHATYALA